MNLLISGAIVMGYLVAGLFFLRFYRRSKESLFVYFAVAFFILAAQRSSLSLTAERFEDHTAFYMIRLLAFSIILFGIWRKNSGK